jgi:ketosteroid isomerase-like protein
MTDSEAEVEAEVLAAAASLVDAFGGGRVPEYFACFAPEATFVFHSEPARLGSREDYRALWERWERKDGFRVLECVSSSASVLVVGPDAAVFTHDVDTRVATDAGTERLAERETIVFARRGGRWLAVHEHLSARPH